MTKQEQILKALEPLIGLKLSIARRGGSMRGLHFGNIRKIKGGTAGDYALHIDGTWRLESTTQIITGSGHDYWTWAFGYHLQAPKGWDPDDITNLQDVRFAELLQGYDPDTRSYVNTTDQLVVEKVEASPFGDAFIYLSGGYRLVLFPTTVEGESWRVFNSEDKDSPHFVINKDFFGGSPYVAVPQEGDKLFQLEPLRSVFHYERAKALKEQGDLSAAIEALNVAVQLNPDFVSAYFVRAEIYRAQANFEQALADLDEVLRLNRHFYYGYCERGNLRMDMSDWETAITDFTRAIYLEPRLSWAYWYRGVARDLEGDLDGALADFSEAIRLHPKDASAYNQRGGIFQQLGKLDSALADFTEAIRLKPDEWMYYRDRGSLHAERGEVELAIRDYQQALTLPIDDKFEDATQEMSEYIAEHTNY